MTSLLDEVSSNATETPADPKSRSWLSRFTPNFSGAFRPTNGNGIAFNLPIEYRILSDNTLNSIYERGGISDNASFTKAIEKGEWLPTSMYTSLPHGTKVDKQFLERNKDNLKRYLKPAGWFSSFGSKTNGTPDVEGLLQKANESTEDDGIVALNQLAASPKLSIRHILDEDIKTDNLVEHVNNMYKCLTILASAVEGKTSKSSMPGAQISSALKTVGTGAALGVGALGMGVGAAASHLYEEGKDLGRVVGNTVAYVPGKISSVAEGAAKYGSVIAHNELGDSEKAKKILSEDFSKYNPAKAFANRVGEISDRTLVGKASRGVSHLAKGARSTLKRAATSLYNMTMGKKGSEGGSYTRRGRNRRRTFRARRV
jgi:hypothetical protein